MRAWIILAHLAALAAGCGGSHTREMTDDGGRPPRDADHIPRDSGPGLDAGSPPEDAGPPPVPGCGADDARVIPCPDLLCDGLPTWHWNGDRCFPIECGACEGVDCRFGAASQALCEEAHASCEATLCRGTGGMWKFWAQQCGHEHCGVVPPEICELGMPACDCGPSRSFEPGAGCVSDETCPLLEPTTPEDACRGSGGTWGDFCCHTDCGQPCPDPCVGPACDCGPNRVFDEARGCIEHERCFDRSPGETCDPGRARCSGGSICCQHCGGAGCFGPATCDPPTCDTDEHTDVCGNRDDVA